MPSPSLLQRLKERKLVQWALAYLAGAFVVFQLLDALAEPLSLTPTLQRSILVIVGIGFLITLILAWYHGEKGRQRVSGPELLMGGALLVIAGVVILRFRQPDTDRPYRAWGHPWSTWACLLGWLFLGLFQAVAEIETAAYAAIMVAISWPAYRALSRRRPE